MRLKVFLRQHWLLIVILGFAAWLRFHRLDYQSLWHDELCTVAETNPSLSPGEVYRLVVKEDAHPPLYFYLVYFMFKLFGYTSYVLRLVSVLSGLASIIGIYMLGREMFNKNTGLCAAALLAVNHFHIQYSQEGRPYAFLLLTTVFSFYWLVRFVRQPDFKRAMLYAAFTTLLIYAHLFALFTLVAQMLVLLYFTFKPNGVSTKRFLTLSAMAGLAIGIMYIPVLRLLNRALGATSSWIPLPQPDVYTQLYRDFFGNAEIVVILTLVFILVYLFYTLRLRDRQTIGKSAYSKLYLSFIVFFTWIFITLLIPLYRSFSVVSMIVNRYFINVLPALLLMAASGMQLIQSAVVRYLIFGCIVAFSLNHLVVVKKYYEQIYKTQFRELSQYIIGHKGEKHRIVCRIGQLLPFYLNNDTESYTIITSWLDPFLDEMRTGEKSVEAFWILDGHFGPEQLSDENKKFLEEQFEIIDDHFLYNGWVRLFKPRAGSAQTSQ